MYVLAYDVVWACVYDVHVKVRGQLLFFFFHFYYVDFEDLTHTSGLSASILPAESCCWSLHFFLIMLSP